ncbi:CopD family protein [Ramlibacter pallidus]|uniref:CopD family protein n=1 Tax=Ramlibacter pallidus TaxID=2780087 RepID=A0ABR9S0Q8_9BURK|nr:CopD family protein [Ramlibacter pallidus]MBE7367068.1 CopD family protein [Ramlibacter pallidus]
MRNLMLFLHLAGAIFWMGGMAFMVMALRPALHAQLQPPARLPLVVAVLRRFFVVVMVSIALLLATGVWLLLQVPGRDAPPGWHAMAGLGIAMMLVFGHIFFAPWRRLQRAVAAGDWPEGGRRMNQIALLVKVNLALGWLAIAAVLLWR